ncbi:hypothetical protein C8J57DRAFT_1253835 [Mycena rebaudengoi]|nr:hypothetical protein C8J57DRAFT_1253835 [Mycena rebaudengoi]
MSTSTTFYSDLWTIQFFDLDDAILGRCFYYLNRRDLANIGNTSRKLFHLTHPLTHPSIDSTKPQLKSANTSCNRRDLIGRLSLEIDSIILNQLDTTCIANMSMTSKHYNAVVKDLFMRRMFKFLSNFDLDPTAFVRTMGKTSTIVGGIAPIIIMSGTDQLPNHVNIYSPSSQEDTVVALLEQQGYHLSTSYAKGGEMQLRMIHSMEKGPKEIRLHISEDENASLPIFSAPSTALMNFISVHGVYCAYPRLTLRKQALLNLAGVTTPRIGPDFEETDTEREILDSFRYTLWPQYSHKCFRSSVCPSTIRTLHDPTSVIFRFPSQKGDGTSSITEDGLIYDKLHTVVCKQLVGEMTEEEEEDGFEPHGPNEERGSLKEAGQRSNQTDRSMT